MMRRSARVILSRALRVSAGAGAARTRGRSRAAPPHVQHTSTASGVCAAETRARAGRGEGVSGVPPPSHLGNTVCSHPYKVRVKATNATGSSPFSEALAVQGMCVRTEVRRPTPLGVVRSCVHCYGALAVLQVGGAQGEARARTGPAGDPGAASPRRLARRRPALPSFLVLFDFRDTPF